MSRGYQQTNQQRWVSNSKLGFQGSEQRAWRLCNDQKGATDKAKQVQ